MAMSGSRTSSGARASSGVSKTPGARLLSVIEAETFIKEKKLGPLEGFRSKRGFLFAGTIVLTDDYKLNFDFESADDDSLEELNYEKKDVIGICPKCSGDVVIHKTSYTCAKSVGKNKSCSFRSGLTILQQTISIEQMTKLLTDGRTEDGNRIKFQPEKQEVLLMAQQVSFMKAIKTG